MTRARRSRSDFDVAWDAEAWLSMDEIVEPDRERRNGNGMPAGLEYGLGFLLGIELAEGDRSE